MTSGWPRSSGWSWTAWQNYLTGQDSGERGRCELSDLPVEMCAHCKTGAKTLGTERKLYEGNWTETAIRFYRKSDRPGTCVCGEPFNTGDQIGWDEEKNWWRAEKCCG